MEQRSKTYVLKGMPQSLVVRRSDDSVGWGAHKHIKAITAIDLQLQHETQPLFTGPLLLEAIFYFNVPCKSRSRNKSQEGDIYSSRPSLFRLMQFLESVSLGIIYDNEALIAHMYGKKIYDHNPRTEFTFTEIYDKKEAGKKRQS